MTTVYIEGHDGTPVPFDESEAFGMDPILCSKCNRPATEVDRFHPQEQGFNRCAVHSVVVHE